MLGMELRGKRLGLVGVGRIGRAVAEKAPAFGMTRRLHGANARSTCRDAEHLPLDRLLATSDVVSLHCPLTPETRHLIDQKALTKMKRSAYLINTVAWSGRRRSGAGVGAEGAADRRRGARRVRGGAATCIPTCSALENVMLIPHIASATTETRTAMADLAASNVLAVLTGEPPLTPV